MAKICPDCGEEAPTGATDCDACGLDFAQAGAVPAPAASVRAAAAGSAPDFLVPPAKVVDDRSIAELTPAELRREIRWGTFQGYLLATMVIIAVSILAWLLAYSVATSGSGSTGSGF